MEYRRKLVGLMLITTVLFTGCGSDSGDGADTDGTTAPTAVTDGDDTGSTDSDAVDSDAVDSDAGDSEPADSETTTSEPSDPSADTSSSIPTTSSATDGSTPETSSPSESADVDAALAFFQATQSACADWSARVGNDDAEAVRFAEATVIGQAEGGEWIIEDGMGDRLLVDMDARVVYSEAGPEGVLPLSYSYGCPEDLYLGSSHD